MSVIRRDGLVFLGGARAVLQIGNNGEGTRQEPAPGAADTSAEHTAAVVKVNVTGAELSIQYAPWGSNNLRPNDLLAEADKSGILKAALTVLRKTHFGTGSFYYRLQADGERENVMPIAESDSAIAAQMAFHRGNRLDHYFQEAIMNHHWWGWTLPEYVLSQDFSQVLSIRCIKTAWGRKSLTNAEGRSEWLVFNPNWAVYNKEFVKVVPIADPWWTPEEVKAWARENGYHKFIRPTMIPDPDAGYYPDPDWHSLYESKWLQNTNKIPVYKDAAMTKAWNLKYHVKIPAKYFAQKFKDTWADMTEAEKLAKENEVLEQMDTWLSGAENAHKAFISRFSENDMGEPLGGSGWEIIPLEDKAKDGALIPDSEKGNSEILAAMGVDPSLLGQGAPGGKLGAGSGSDKFEAIRILHALLYADQDMTLESWHFLRDYNGWSKDIYIGFRPLEVSLPEPPKKEATSPEPRASGEKKAASDAN